MATQHYQISELPQPYPFYAKAVIGRRRYREGQELSLTSVEWPDFSFPAAAVRAYARLCQWPLQGDDLPLLFPHSYLGPLHLLMLTDSNFPMKVLGGVHLRNHLVQHRPLRLGERYSARLQLTSARQRPQGLEVDFKTEIHQKGAPRWESVTTFLFRRKFKVQDPETPRAGLLENLVDAQEKASFPIPLLTGKQFGWITKDINPIHMSSILARAFGFERDLCHGMWALSRSLPLVGGVDWQKPLRNDVIFKGPLYMQHDVTIKVGRKDQQVFELYSAGNERPCVLASLRNSSDKV